MKESGLRWNPPVSTNLEAFWLAETFEDGGEISTFDAFAEEEFRGFLGLLVLRLMPSLGLSDSLLWREHVSYSSKPSRG